jgi:hypothetical protein
LDWSLFYRQQLLLQFSKEKIFPEKLLNAGRTAFADKTVIFFLIVDSVFCERSKNNKEKAAQTLNTKNPRFVFINDLTPKS